MGYFRQIQQQTKSLLNTREKSYSLCITLLICLIIVTPLCGFLFLCGCDWPWDGLNAGCNYYQQHSVHQCPWCTSLVAGGLSTGLALLAALWCSIANIQLIQGRVNEIVARISLAVIIFVLIAALTAALSAHWLGYPMR